MEEARSQREAKLLKEKEILEKQAEAFRAFLNGIPLNLEDGCLTKVDLAGLNLKNIKLKDALLQCARLSTNVVVPNYSCNHSSLFDKWINGNEEEQRYFQDLLNAGVYSFYGVSNDLLKGVNWGSKDLTNADFSHTDLRGCNLRRLNAQNSLFYFANLIGSNFDGADLRKAKLKHLLLSNGQSISDYSYEYLCNTFQNNPDSRIKKLAEQLLRAIT